MLEKGKRNKNETKNIDIQGFDVILQLGVGYRLLHPVHHLRRARRTVREKGWRES